ncbi:hypothetical protein TNCV_4390411 [Trichonephila clavipes]|nr:hypothetical protein TNCV_4390411 [Trichonephila clavipes]
MFMKRKYPADHLAELFRAFRRYVLLQRGEKTRHSSLYVCYKGTNSLVSGGEIVSSSVSSSIVSMSVIKAHIRVPKETQLLIALEIFQNLRMVLDKHREGLLQFQVA